MGFKVGDPVVYPAQGGGYIREIAERKVMGEVNTYYVIELIRKPGTIMVPVEKATELGLRPPLRGQELEELLRALGEARDLASGWPARQREIGRALSESDPLELARMLASMHKRHLNRPLSGTEHQQYRELIGILSEELALAGSGDLREAEDLLLSKLDEYANQP
ncbi:CarD family transcriptional regulator [Oceanithermus sp.]